MKLPPSYTKPAILIAALTFSVGALLGQQAPTPNGPPDEATQQSQQTAVQLDPFHVSASQAGGYGAADTTSGSRIALPIVDVPFSLVVVTRELMDDTAANTYVDALSYVSGMNAGSDVLNGDMVVRGVEIRGSSFSVIDGLDTGFEALQENLLIDRYEVVKGPAGTLYGDYSVGGMVNRIYKSPTATPFTQLMVTYNSFGELTEMLDSGGPIGDGQLAYRVVALAAEGEEVTRAPNDRHGIYFQLNYTPKGSRTKFWGRYSQEYWLFNEDGPDDLVDVTGYTSGQYGFSAREKLNAGVATEDDTQRYAEFGVTTSTSGFLGDWASRFVVRYTQVIGDPDPRPQNVPLQYNFYDAANNLLGSLGTTPNPSGAPNPTFRGSPWKDIILADHEDYWIPSTSPNVGQQAEFSYDLTGAFKTGPLDHQLLVYTQMIFHWEHDFGIYLHLLPQFGGALSDGDYVEANSYSIVHPQTWTGPAQSMSAYEPWTYASAYARGDYFDEGLHSTSYSAGIQDNISLLDKRVLLVGGARFDDIQNDGLQDLYAQTEGLGTSTTNWVYKASTVFKPLPNPGVSLFLNFSQTFVPEYGETFPGSGIQLKNETGTAKEIGIKAELFDSRLIGTFSYFHNTLDNNPVFVVNPATGRNYNIQNGVANFPGFEGDATWKVNDNISLLFSVSDVHALQSNGEGFRNSPIGLGYRALARYSFSRDTALRGLAFGVGVINVPQRYGSNGNYYNINGYTEINAFANYSIGHWKLQANIQNLNEVKAVLSALGQMAYNQAVYPSNIDLSIRYTF